VLLYNFFFDTMYKLFYDVSNQMLTIIFLLSTLWIGYIKVFILIFQRTNFYI